MGRVMLSCGAQGRVLNVGQMLTTRLEVCPWLEATGRRDLVVEIQVQGWRRASPGAGAAPAPSKSFHLAFSSSHMQAPAQDEKYTCRWMCRLQSAGERKWRKGVAGGLPASSCSGRWPPGTVLEGHRCTQLIRSHTLVPLVWRPPGTDRLEGDQELGASNTCLASNRFLPRVFASLAVLSAPDFPLSLISCLLSLTFKRCFIVLSFTFTTLYFLHPNCISPDWVWFYFLYFIFQFKSNVWSPL